jgi:DNA invertase Pin-like site-specific DNA recombinase
MKFGYARVSTKDQKLDLQIERLKAAGCEEIFSEIVSGAKSERTELNRMLDKLRAGDVVCVVRLDRLGRRLKKLIDLITMFKEKKIDFVSLEDNIDTHTTMGMAIFNIMASMAEMERQLICDRSRAGVKSAQAKGIKFGRPKIMTPEKFEMTMALKNAGEFSVIQICKMVGISRTSYYRLIEINENKKI